MGRIVNQRELSEITGVSQVSLWTWGKEGMPVLRTGATGEENQYDTEAVIRWMIDREVARLGVVDQKDRLARLQGDKIEMELAGSRGELVPAAAIEPTWSSIVTAVRQAALALPVRLAPLLEATPGVDAKRALIEEEVHDVLQKLSTYEHAGPDDDGAPGDGEVRAAQEDPAQPVG